MKYRTARGEETGRGRGAIRRDRRAADLCFWMFFSVASFLASWTRPRPSWSPTWPQLGPILEPCWAFFGTFLGVVVASHLKIVLETIFDRLRTPLNLKKPTKTGLFLIFLLLLLVRS